MIIYDKVMDVYDSYMYSKYGTGWGLKEVSIPNKEVEKMLKEIIRTIDYMLADRLLKGDKQ